jgi:hypothetical protein
MSAPGWHSQQAADVPAGDDWLGDNERLVLAGLEVERRRADWRAEPRWVMAVGGEPPPQAPLACVPATRLLSTRRS